MLLEDYFDFLNPDDIRIKGHRIGIQDVIKYYLCGYSPEEILEELPSWHWFRPMRSRKSYSARSVGICCQSWLTWFLSKKCLYTLFLC
ncbi:DUF433 domain-containing protein [Pseudanabaena sp. FACHB-1277]|uniref:DUF433 domain-containing protein n=1 Tax=Pseudanabaena cinerea FACHB-1277 TaxID=2949581 RepID=A0A926UXL6_9CYAN|nr:DUF433 domain-containing protein [Pseudanabaena cinerea FACHB-1277]